ncbi:hypothetical protein BKA82DRAFT_995351 [Pisolithus tinctorius]|uniref:BCNT-C domain-containing protein n=2 Tax=Pisolithus TaxID=37467 RepID=A0A0C3PB88_PISTI|nr:hypothetical protein BKA82DRAFT_995351 [Pisolithus tinctorius]KIO10925.1 hypothetical protein M404DRAFT_995351 [Pisolithus tinctorius Marx 270]
MADESGVTGNLINEDDDYDRRRKILALLLIYHQLQLLSLLLMLANVLQLISEAEAESLEDESECNSTSERAEEERLLSTAPDPASKATSGTRPGPHQPRIPILDSSKVKKIMDWRAHVASQLASQSRGVQVELTANKRRGGYLERVDFLQRVQDRRQDVLEDPRPNKRRKK